MKRIKPGKQKVSLRNASLLAGLFLLIAGCGPQQSGNETDTADDGTIYVSADESFKP
ncbi:MAG: hypothetical protein JSU05_08920, partial [Bacteroidetes bacterium]|nr:hypothetical protein [Bacteroidota bacterium]